MLWYKSFLIPNIKLHIPYFLFIVEAFLLIVKILLEREKQVATDLEGQPQSKKQKQLDVNF